MKTNAFANLSFFLIQKQAAQVKNFFNHYFYKPYYIYLFIFYLVLAFFLNTCTHKKNEISGSGTIEADEISIASLVPARVKILHKKEGESFLEGELLVTLTADDVRADVDQGEASKEAALRNVKQAEANYLNATDEYKRISKLFDAGSASKQQLDAARTRYTVTESIVLSAKAQLKQSEALTKRARVRFQETLLHAPGPGIVLKTNYLPGEVVLTASPIMTVADMSLLHLRIFVAAPDLPRFRIGDKADIQIDGYAQKVTGKVIYVSQVSEFTPKNVQTKDARARLVYAVKIQFENKEGNLKAGMPASAIIHSSIEKP